MKPYDRRLLWGAPLALAWLADWLWRYHPLSLSWTLFIWLTLALGGWLAAFFGGRRFRGRLWALAGLAAVFAALFALRAEPLTFVLSWLFSLGLTVLAFAFLPEEEGETWLRWGLFDYLSGLLRLTLNVISAGMEPARRLPRQDEGPQSDWETGWALGRGLLLALPVVAFFSLLLAEADPLFAARLDAALKVLNLRALGHLLFIGLLTVGLRGLWLHGALSPARELTEANRFRFLGGVEALVVLGSVAALFAAFLLLQASYFFGGVENISLDGLTYAEYARRGFGELSLAAFFVLVLLLALQALARLEQAQGFRALSAFLVLETLILLLSAWQRLVLYEEAYGYTRLRLYTHAAIIWIGFLLAGTLWFLWRERMRYFPALALGVAAAFTLTLGMVNVDAFIVRRNVDRAAARGEALDADYLTQLSADAVPALVAAWRQDPESETGELLGAVLRCQWENLNRQGEPRGHFADWRALRLLRGLDLSAFSSDGVMIETPSGGSVYCFSRWD